MNETQILIKTSIENETKQQLGVDVIVEYVKKTGVAETSWREI